MHTLAAIALVVVVAAQEAPPPLPEEEAPAATTETAPPVAPPADAAPLAPTTPPPPAKSTAPTPPPQSSASAEGMNPFLTAFLQCGAGCLTALLVNIGGCIPILGWIIVCVAGPILVGLVETVVGDLLGDSRGTLLWTTLAAFGGAALYVTIATIGGLVSSLFFGAGYLALGAALASGQDPAVAFGAFIASYFGALVVVGAVSLIGLALYPAIPALTYMLTAEKKLPGDSEFRFPGFVAPAHKQQEAALPPLGKTRRAMAY